MTTIENIDKELKAVDEQFQQAIGIAASKDPACIRLDERMKSWSKIKKMLQDENGKADADSPPSEPEKKTEKK
jgi:hypothetical protein